MDLRWRLVSILVVVGICVALVYPPAAKIHLGLDLKGGIHMVMRVKTDDAVKAELDLSQERVRQSLGEKGLAPAQITTDGLHAVVLSGLDPNRIGEARDLLASQYPQYQIDSPGAG